MEGSWTEKDDTSSAKFQSEEAGLVDFVGTEEEILSQIRELVCMIPGNNEEKRRLRRMRGRFKP